MLHENERRIELLTDELMAIKGWGVAPHRLAPMPRLRELAEVEAIPDSITAGSIILRYLVAAIESLPERHYDFDGKRYTAGTMKAAFYLELRIGTTDKHPRRQYRLMVLLGLRYSHNQWRKHPRLERSLLTILAEHMVRQSNLQTA